MILEEITSFISNTGYLSYQTKALVLKHKHTPAPLEGSLEYTSWAAPPEFLNRNVWSGAKDLHVDSFLDDVNDAG